MYIYNFKINGGLILRLIIIFLSLIMLGVFLISIYRIFFSNGRFTVKDSIKSKEVTEINPDNYTNILEAVHNDLPSYIGMKINFTGYVYRVFDFNNSQFVLARDMFINEDKTQTVVVGFLTEYKDAEKLGDGTWLNLTGVIEEGKYHNEVIPVVKVLDFEEVPAPEDRFVFPPSNTYVPTSGIF